jgi:ATP-dependent Lon protease
VLRSVGWSRQAQPPAETALHCPPGALVEANFNFIELGPRGTGKSYFFSEFSPYATLISGGQASKATLFYNNARRQASGWSASGTLWPSTRWRHQGPRPDTIQIMKDYMANGRFSRGVEVIADASMAFVGNIDHSVEQVVNSTEYDLFMPLPERVRPGGDGPLRLLPPGWEMPKNSSEFLPTTTASSPTTWPRLSTTSSSIPTGTKR